MRKVFISHSTVDKELVEIVQELIETGIGLKHDEVFCTSIVGLGIPDGADFKAYMRQELNECDTVVALISPNYYASAFCMCELGATWMLAKNFFPILVPPVDFKDLHGTLPGIQCRRLYDATMPSALYDRLSKLIAKPVPVARFDLKKKLFLDKLPDIVKMLTEPAMVSRKELEVMKEEVEQIKSVALELEQENEALKKQIAELAKAKDAMAVATIQKKYSTEWQRFDSLREAAQAAFKRLDRAVKEAIYHSLRGEAWQPDHLQWGDEVQSALEEELLVEDGNRVYAFWPNEERPTVKDAVKKITALTEFLENGSSPEFDEQASLKFGDTPSLKRRSFFNLILR